MKLRSITYSCAVLLSAFASTSALPHDPPPGGCGSFAGDVAHEMTVMRLPPVSINATADAAGAQPLLLDEHYAINLIAQNQLRFRVKPRRAAKSGAPRGGTFQFQVPVTGRYRVSITSRHWVDVVDGVTAIPSVNHLGPGCDLLHKIVEFDLASGKIFTLQLSGQDDAIIGLAITPSPSPPPAQDRT